MIFLYFFREDFVPGFSLNVLVIDFLLCFLAMSGKRMLTRIIRESAARASGTKDVRTILLGSTDSLNHVIQALTATPSKRRVIGVLSDDIKIGNKPIKINLNNALLNGKKLPTVSYLIRALKIMKIDIKDIIETIQMIKDLGAIDADLEIRE